TPASVSGPKRRWRIRPKASTRGWRCASSATRSNSIPAPAIPPSSVPSTAVSAASRPTCWTTRTCGSSTRSRALRSHAAALPHNGAMPDLALLDALTTPVAWTGADGYLAGANTAFARWLGVGVRRLPGLPLAALEADGERLAGWLAQAGDDAIRLRRVPVAFPGGAAPAAVADPAQALPLALSAALKGLAHELRNPLAGLKGAAQLLARRAERRLDNDEERELTALIGAEVDRLSALLDRLLSPAPAEPHAPLNI